jgi:hypothetical protein
MLPVWGLRPVHPPGCCYNGNPRHRNWFKWLLRTFPISSEVVPFPGIRVCWVSRLTSGKSNWKPAETCWNLPKPAETDLRLPRFGGRASVVEALGSKCVLLPEHWIGLHLAATTHRQLSWDLDISKHIKKQWRSGPIPLTLTGLGVHTDCHPSPRTGAQTCHTAGAVAWTQCGWKDITS